MKTWASNASIPVGRPTPLAEAEIPQGTGSSVLSQRKRKTVGFGKNESIQAKISWDLGYGICKHGGNCKISTKSVTLVRIIK